MVSHWAAPPELSRPLQTLTMQGMYVGDDDDESFSKIERQQLLEIGVSTFHVDPDYTCRVDRVRTLRKNNDWGDPDPSWADAITMFQSMYFVRQIRQAITGAYPRAALTNYPRASTALPARRRSASWSSTNTTAWRRRVWWRTQPVLRISHRRA